MSLAKPAKVVSAWWRRGFEWVSNGWSLPRDFWQAIVVTRGSVILVLAGWLLLASDQGRDILIFVGERVGSRPPSEAWWPLISFVFVVSLWVVSAWYWALTMLRFELPRWQERRCDERCRHRLRWFVRWIPLVLGVAAFAAVFRFLDPNVHGISPSARQGLIASRVAIAIAGAFFVTFELVHQAFFKRSAEPRTELQNRLVDRGWARWMAWLAAAFVVGIRWREPRRRDLDDFLRRQWWVSTVVLASSIGGGVILLIWSWIDPVSVGNVFRADVLFFVWAACLIGIVSLLAYTAEAYRLPVLLFFLTCAVIFSFWNDNHQIRFDAPQKGDPAARPTVAKAAETWASAAFADDEPAAAEPLIVVATAGGGSRAAYWTATVLGTLQDCYPTFRDHVFGVSGVSGGSLGAAVFRAVLTDHQGTPAPGCSRGEVKPVADGVAAMSQAVLGKDFLTANVASLLFPDLVARLLPWPAKSADRASAIELAWEDAYQRVAAPGSEDRVATMAFGGFDRSFVNAWAGPLPIPATEAAGKSWPGPGLFLNGTWVETGRRVVMSSFKLKDSAAAEPELPAFAVADDFFDLVGGKDIRLSTAAGLSARFPLVLPAATIEGVGRIVDGGYFENYGAETASEVLAVALKSVNKPVCQWPAGKEQNKTAADPPCVVPVVILISSDPTLPDKFLARPEDVEPVGGAYELRSPFRTFLKTREARGLFAAAGLEKKVRDTKGTFVHFRMCTSDSGGDEGTEQRDPPLGWALSDHAQGAIKTLLAFQPSTCAEQNKKAWAALHDLLKPVEGYRK